ncbi:hypothetical protein HMPREF2853_04620 [Streptococcus sp. HMSC077F03]|nr:hypothetical protein HMPREF2853_04620 [Streptococcus sp. HMSC077F03]
MGNPLKVKLEKIIISRPLKYNNTLRKSLQTTSASPCRTQVLPASSFLVCSLIFIEYKNRFSQFKEKKDKFLSILTSLAGTALVLVAIWLGWPK